MMMMMMMMRWWVLPVGCSMTGFDRGMMQEYLAISPLTERSTAYGAQPCVLLSCGGSINSTAWQVQTLRASASA
jgi:hypothetical protein